MNVILIWPFNQQLKKVQELFPLAFGYIISNIDRAVHKVTLLDCAIDRMDPDSTDFRTIITSLKPDVVGVSWWSSNTEVVKRTLAVVKSICNEAVTVVGGSHPTVAYQSLLDSPTIDFIFRGEAEIGFPMLLDCIHEKKYSELYRIPGLIFRDTRGKSVINEQLYVSDLDSLGKVDYETLRLRRYHEAGYNYGGKAELSEGVLSAPIVATRGCPYLCEFCSSRAINGRIIRFHSAEYIANTITDLYTLFNVRLISFIDDNFTFKTEYAEEVCDKIIKARLNELRIATPIGIRFERMTKRLANKMYAAGWRDVVIAPESGSPRTLRHMRKAVNLKKGPEAVALFHDAGIKIHAFFMIGYPGETSRDLLTTERFILENGFDNIDLHIFQPLPGTPVFDKLVKKKEIKPGFIPGGFYEVTYKPQELSREEIRDIANRILNEFRDRKGWVYKDSAVYCVREHTALS
ncbi:MAG: radical SAM protein [Candidatus Omnitrophota bacterium]